MSTYHMDDKEYIKELENMVCWLAHCYESVKYEFHHKHLETCDFRNPNRRELTETEEREIGRFPMIQGSGNLFVISRLAETKRKPTIPLREIEKIIMSNEKEPLS